MKTDHCDYLNSEELITQTPIEPRDHSRLMVISRNTGKIQHRLFYELPDYLEAGDAMVFNDSRVFPVRLYAKRTDTSALVELLSGLPVQSPSILTVVDRMISSPRGNPTLPAHGESV